LGTQLIQESRKGKAVASDTTATVLAQALIRQVETLPFAKSEKSDS